MIDCSEPKDQEPLSEVQWLAQIIRRREIDPRMAEEMAREVHDYFAGTGFRWEGFRKELMAAHPNAVATAAAAAGGLTAAVWTLYEIFEKRKG